MNHKLVSFNGKKVFVTGHTGFKGAWLCQVLLEFGAVVHGFSLPEWPTEPCLFEQLNLTQRLTDIRGDVRDAKAVAEAVAEAQPDFVFHLAAQPLVRLSYEIPAQTYETNVLGTIHVLEALRKLEHPCVAVMITTDKCYENLEWLHGYREEDALGGYDPYSSSKAAAELAIASWRRSFFRKHPVRIASVRAGNVIGGGDWASDRIVPDIARSLNKPHPLMVRNPHATRPWQHVLEPIGGYLALAAKVASTYEAGAVGEAEGSPSALAALLASEKQSAAAFNFGPRLDSNRSVLEVVREMHKHLNFSYEIANSPDAPHEAGRLNLATDKAFHLLGWQPKWDFEVTIANTAQWYRAVLEGGDPLQITRQQIADYFGVNSEWRIADGG